jgi:serine/threonine protein kinase
MQSHPALNRTLNGRYRLIAQLGAGGMGITYRAWDGTRELPCVVKMPRPEQSTEESVQRFGREIEAMVALQHPHIVPILDHGSDGGVPFVVMRLLPGGSLADQRRVNADGTIMPTPPGFLHHWLPSIAEAIDFVHRHGVMHRDVKPRNIFFDGFGNAFLGDFGIAKVLDESGGLAREQTLTATSFAMGTEEYMAPELFMKANRDKQTGQVDQYALAVTVYEMLAGVRPFTGSTAHVAVEHLQMKPPSLGARGLGLPASLCAAIDRGLAKKPDDRFPNCAAFAAAAIKDVPSLPAEPGIARLLCPTCNAILRIPVTSGGRSGACPTCKSMVRIAADLGALWLRSEDTDDRGPAASEPETTFDFDEELSQAASARPSIPDFFRRLWDASRGAAAAGWLMPAIAAAVAFGVTHELWSDHHRQVVARLERLRETDVLELRTRSERAEADARQMTHEHDLLVHEYDELGKTVAASSFVGVTTLSPEIAAALARWKRGDLMLDDLVSISDDVAAALSGHEGTLSLNGLTRLSDKAAASLAGHRGPVMLGGLLTVSENAVRLLRSKREIRLPDKIR